MFMYTIQFMAAMLGLFTILYGIAWLVQRILDKRADKVRRRHYI